MPAWEGTGIRRRAATTATGQAPKDPGAVPAQSAAQQAQQNRAQRRSGYDANKPLQPNALRPQAGWEGEERVDILCDEALQYQVSHIMSPHSGCRGLVFLLTGWDHDC